jgi:hypothetical protein
MDQSDAGAKLTYSAPEIESLGTIAEITASGHGNGSFDGAGYTASSSGGGPGGPHGS